MGFLLRHINGTYYRRFISGFGPEFGAQREDAEQFGSIDSAVREMGKHWAMGDATIEEISPAVDQPRPCTVPDCGRCVGDCPHIPGQHEAGKDQFERMYRRS